MNKSIRNPNTAYSTQLICDICQHIANGDTVKEAAEKMCRNSRTLEGIILYAKDKHKAKSITHLIAILLRGKLIR